MAVKRGVGVVGESRTLVLYRWGAIVFVALVLVHAFLGGAAFS